MEITQMKKVQEEERKRIARTLHDGPIQSLTNIVWAAGVCEKLLETNLPKAKDEVGKLKQLARNALQELRGAVGDLRNSGGSDWGLATALSEYISTLPSTDFPGIRYSVRGREGGISPETEHCLLAIVHECCTNIRKHAKANKVTVKLKFTPRTLFLSIRDDGVGFDYPQYKFCPGERNKFGLVGIEEQIALINGKLRLRSARGKGTRLLIAAPLHQTGKKLREQEGE